MSTMPSRLASKEGVCPICEGRIPVGGEIWPIEEPVGDQGQTKFRWAHIECMRNKGLAEGQTELVAPECPFFRKRGTCLHGDDCFFRHVVRPGMLVRKTNGCVKTIQPDATSSEDLSKSAKKITFGKYGRAGVYRRWLLDNFWEELQPTGKTADTETTTVLDIAGGKGEVSFELAKLNGAACTVFDPRDLDLSEFEDKWRRGRFHCNPSLTKWNRGEYYLRTDDGGDSPKHDGDDGLKPLSAAEQKELDSNRKAPPIRHVRAYFDQSLIDWVTTGEAYEEEELICTPVDCEDLGFLARNAKRIADSVIIGESTKKQKYKKVHGKLILLEKVADPDTPDKASSTVGDSTTSSPVTPSTVASTASDTSTAPKAVPNKNTPTYEVDTDEEVLRILQNAALVTGMHLDGAAEASVDFALALNKPFAIVPCCTCSKDFPSRLLDGKLVRQYDDLVEYLMRKDKRIQKSTLDFEGKNVVLWMKP